MRRGIFVALALLATGCGTFAVRSSPVVSQLRFTDPDREFTFEVPRTWRLETGPHVPAEAAGWIARGRSRSGAVIVAASAVPPKDGDCAAGVEAWLRGRGAKIVEPQAIAFQAGARSAAGRRGTLALDPRDDMERSVSYLCEAGHAVMLEGAASARASADEKRELAAIFGSLAIVGEDGLLGSAWTVPRPEPLVHHVESRGQTLKEIAEWYTGRGDNWARLTAPVNPDLRVCCAELRVGRDVTIPSDLVIRRDPLKEIASSRRAHRTPSSTKSASSAEAMPDDGPREEPLDLIAPP